MIEYNMGVKKENEAKEHLEKIYNNVKRTKYAEFYDYLVKKGTTEILIEVKWLECRYKTVQLYIRWKQAMKLLRAEEFMLYILTPKGNFFISPSQVYSFAHVHYNQLNPSCKKVFITATIKNGTFEMIEPSRCLYCNGKLLNYLRENPNTITEGAQ